MSFDTDEFVLLPSGDIDFETMYDTHGGFGVCFYLAFVLIMTFIVLNMFLAILGDSFTDVKEELKDAKNQYELLDFCKGIVMVGDAGTMRLTDDIILLWGWSFSGHCGFDLRGSSDRNVFKHLTNIKMCCSAH